MASLTAVAEGVLAATFVAALWPRPDARLIRSHLAPVVGSLAAAALLPLAGDLGPPWRAALTDATFVAIFLQPFLLLRLVAIVTPIAAGLRRGVAVATVAALAVAVVAGHAPPTLRLAAQLTIAAFLVALEAFAAIALWQGGRRAAGAARERAVTLAIASALIALLFALAIVAGLSRAFAVPNGALGGLAVAVAFLYVAAVAPPLWLRHAWQMPVLYRYYAAMDALPEGDETALAGVLLDTAAGATGSVAGGYMRREAERPVYHRLVGRGRALRAPLVGASFEVGPDDALERAWRTGQPVVEAVGAASSLPGMADLSGVHRAVCVPVGVGGERLGVLRLFTPVDWLFLRDDLTLLTALAQHAAARIKGARAFADEAAAADALRSANRALAEASRAKSDFLSGMSHELRTPLNAIIGFSDLLLQGQGGELGERQRRYVGNILESGQHLLQIVNDVLDIAKADAARLDIRPAAHPLAVLVDGALLLVRAQADAGGVRLDDASDREAWVWVDELRARQVLVNLLSNAVKFTPRGGRVVVRSQRRGDAVEVAVADTGIGIAPEHLASVFDEFTQVSHGVDRAYEGTGLGLPLVRRLVEAMGGGVRAESAPGAGSTFTVWFPAATASAGAPSAAVAGGVDARPPGRAPVLVVDDDRMAREFCVHVLGDAGYEVTAVAGLEEARAALVRRPPRLVLLDILLDGEYGDGLFEAIGALEPAPRVVVVSIVDAGRRPLPGPVAEWLVKPVRPDRLREAVARALATGAEGTDGGGSAGAEEGTREDG